MIKSRRFFVRHGSNQHEVVWKLNLGSKIFHAVRPKGNVTACGKKYRLVDPPPEATDPSDCEDTCLECAGEVIRIVDQPKPVDLKRVIWKARQAQN